MDDKLLEILVCPKCKGKLKESKDRLLCEKCGKEYEVKDGIPVLLP